MIQYLPIFYVFYTLLAEKYGGSISRVTDNCCFFASFGWSELPLITGTGTRPASETTGGQFEGRRYRTEVIYGNYDCSFIS